MWRNCRQNKRKIYDLLLFGIYVLIWTYAGVEIREWKISFKSSSSSEILNWSHWYQQTLWHFKTMVLPHRQMTRLPQEAFTIESHGKIIISICDLSLVFGTQNALSKTSYACISLLRLLGSKIELYEVAYPENVFFTRVEEVRASLCPVYATKRSLYWEINCYFFTF